MWNYTRHWRSQSTGENIIIQPYWTRGVVEKWSLWIEAGDVWAATPLLWKGGSIDLRRQPPSTTIKSQKTILSETGGIVDLYQPSEMSSEREKKVSLLGVVCLFEGKWNINKHQPGLRLWTSGVLDSSPSFSTKSLWPWTSPLGSIFWATITAPYSKDLCFQVSCCSGFYT